jgi:hypothetical protein
MSLETCRELVRKLVEGDSACSFRNEDDWKKVEDIVKTWFAFVKVKESDDTFAEAFREERMTMRAILETRQTGYHEPEVKLRGKERSGFVRKIRTMQGVAGIKERMTSANFHGVGAMQRAKYEKGLFDVSAALLNPKLSLKIGGGAAGPPPPRAAAAAGPPPLTATAAARPAPPPPPKSDGDQNQIYRATGDTTYVFMPVPREGDMYVFYMLTLLAKESNSQGFKQFVSYMKSRFTRIKFAFDGDAGAKFLDFATSGELPPKIRYGFGNLLPATASDAEIKRRRQEATRYRQILASKKRNEIIIAYRQHGELARQPSTFPLYAKGVFVEDRLKPSEPAHKGYVVVNDQMQPTGQIITLGGEMKAGSEHTLGGRMDAYPKDGTKTAAQ